MGLISSRQMLADLYNRFVGSKEFKMIMVGLDAAGKTTVLYKIKFNEGKLIQYFLMSIIATML
jgi:hypothetical protein